jgi:hypothetical protein
MYNEEVAAAVFHPANDLSSTSLRLFSDLSPPRNRFVKVTGTRALQFQPGGSQRWDHLSLNSEVNQRSRILYSAITPSGSSNGDSVSILVMQAAEHRFAITSGSWQDQ